MNLKYGRPTKFGFTDFFTVLIILKRSFTTGIFNKFNDCNKSNSILLLLLQITYTQYLKFGLIYILRHFSCLGSWMDGLLWIVIILIWTLKPRDAADSYGRAPAWLRAHISARLVHSRGLVLFREGTRSVPAGDRCWRSAIQQVFRVARSLETDWQWTPLSAVFLRSLDEVGGDSHALREYWKMVEKLQSSKWNRKYLHRQGQMDASSSPKLLALIIFLLKMWYVSDYLLVLFLATYLWPSAHSIVPL